MTPFYLAILLFATSCASLDLFPYGEDEGDDFVRYESYVKCVDVSGFGPLGHDTGTALQFLGRSENTLCTNALYGIVSLGSGEIGGHLGTNCFRHLTHYSVMPFMGLFERDVDGGSVTHRVTKEPGVMGSVKHILSTAFPTTDKFQLDVAWAYVVTYFNKTTYASSTVAGCEIPKNTIQCIIVGGKSQSFVIFNFKQLQWSAPPAGCPGYKVPYLNDPPIQLGDAVVGIMNNKGDFKGTGDFVHHYLPGSCSPKVLDLAHTSNIGDAGVWVYRTDGKRVKGSTPQPSPTPTTTAKPNPTTVQPNPTTENPNGESTTEGGTTGESTTHGSLTSTTEGPSTTERPYEEIPCEMDSELKLTKGSLTVEKITSNSKFVYIDTKPEAGNTFSVVENECKLWGLRLAKIKSSHDLEEIEIYLDSRGDKASQKDTTYRVAGYNDDPNKKPWRYAAGESKNLYYQKFWGMAPLGLKTEDKLPNSPDSIILRWGQDNATSEQLFMLDVEADSQFYGEMSYFCEYPESSECFAQSGEEYEFESLQDGLMDRDQITKLFVRDQVVYGNRNQKSFKESEEYCKHHNLTMMDLKLGPVDVKQLHGAFSKHIGAMVGVWVNSTADPEFEMDFLTDNHLDPGTDVMLKFKDVARTGRKKYTGKCRVMGITGSDDKFYLQQTPCDVPNLVLCV